MASSSRDAPQPAASASRGASQPASEASDLWVHIFDFTDLCFAAPGAVSEHVIQVVPGRACVIGAVSQLWCSAVQALPQHRLAGIKWLAHQRFPQLESDIETWGEPYAYFPLPTWRLWRVDVWWLAKGSWERQEQFHFVALSELQRVYWQMLHLPGLYQFRRLELSSWTWDYEDGEWAEEDHR